MALATWVFADCLIEGGLGTAAIRALGKGRR
jgi:hypothetical protein